MISYMVKSTVVVYLPSDMNKQDDGVRDRHELGAGVDSCNLLSGFAGINDGGCHHRFGLFQAG